MTFRVWFFLWHLVPLAYAGFVDLPPGELYQHKVQKSPQVGPKAKTRSRRKQKSGTRAKDDRALRELLEQDQKILKLLEAGSRQMVIKRSEEKIMALTRVRGTLLNSMVAMNTAPTTFIVRIEEGDLEGAELKCQGQSFRKRVISKCGLLVAEEREYPVTVEIWDLDGAQGIIADYIYSGEEKSFLSSSLASFLQGTLEATKGQVMTPLGEVAAKNARNQALSGLSNIAQNAREKIAQSGDDKLSIAYINAGKSVLVFFHESLKLSEEVRP